MFNCMPMSTKSIWANSLVTNLDTFLRSESVKIVSAYFVAIDNDTTTSDPCKFDLILANPIVLVVNALLLWL